jgi:hypothetical protein
MKSCTFFATYSVFSLLGFATTHCAVGDNAAEPATGQATLALTARARSGSDVSRIRFEITRVSCEGEDFEPLYRVAERDLEPTVIPGGISELEDKPLDSRSEHLFSDFFVTLPPGCYDVETTPLNADGNPSTTCRWARESKILVEEGRTTEVLLINQRAGRDPGALDAIATLNHEPGHWTRWSSRTPSSESPANRG